MNKALPNEPSPGDDLGVRVVDCRPLQTEVISRDAPVPYKSTGKVRQKRGKSSSKVRENSFKRLDIGYHLVMINVKTRMHSSRMRTVCCSGSLRNGEGGGVSA